MCCHDGIKPMTGQQTIYTYKMLPYVCMHECMYVHMWSTTRLHEKRSTYNAQSWIVGFAGSIVCAVKGDRAGSKNAVFFTKT